VYLVGRWMLGDNDEKEGLRGRKICE
jgi:hypothetical protein